MGKFGPLLLSLDWTGHVWTNLDKSGQIRTSPDEFLCDKKIFWDDFDTEALKHQKI